MSACIPDSAVPCETPLGGWKKCPVCASPMWMQYFCWTESGSKLFGCRCPCSLFETGNGAVRIGFEWQTNSRALWHGGPITIETRALHERRSEWAAFTLSSAMEWLVFADWLEEQGFPLNAAGIRANFSSPFEEYK